MTTLRTVIVLMSTQHLNSMVVMKENSAFLIL